jgi:exonuclease III
MPNFLRLALWNANGLSQHVAELQTFISQYNIDIMVISETHFTDKSYLKLRNYTAYHTSRNCSRRKRRTPQKLHTAPPLKQLLF